MKSKNQNVKSCWLLIQFQFFRMKKEGEAKNQTSIKAKSDIFTSRIGKLSDIFTSRLGKLSDIFTSLIEFPFMNSYI